MINVTRRGPKTKNATKFSVQTFEAMADDLKKGAIPLKKMTIVDDIQIGLRAIIRDTGLISYHVTYKHKDSHLLLKIGDHPDITINKARERAKTIIELGKKGIDVQEGLHDRLMRELDAKGTHWRP